MVEHVCDMFICPVHFESVVNNFDKSKVFSHKTHIKIAKLLKVPGIPSDLSIRLRVAARQCLGECVAKWTAKYWSDLFSLIFPGIDNYARNYLHPVPGIIY